MPSAERFEVYVGRTVGVVEKEVELKFEGSEGLPPILRCTLVPGDPIVEAIRSQAKAEGLRLRVLLPGSVSTADWKVDRLNVHVKKGGSGYYVERVNLG